MPAQHPTVVLTRAPEDNAPLRERLVDHGFDVVEWPALATESLAPAGGPDAVATALSGSAWVVFSSRRGVGAARDLLGAGGLTGALSGARVAAIGAATAGALRDVGIAVELVGEGEGAAALAPSLTAATRPGEGVALVRSTAAEDPLPGLLRHAGLAVKEIALHRPVPPAPRCEPPRPIAAVVCASPSAARTVLSWNPWCARAPFVAIGTTTARALADELGVATVVTSAGTDMESLLEAVLAASAAGASPRPGRPLSEAAFERARRVIPGGVNSPVRAFRAVGGTPVFFERARGSVVWDLDGNRYVDFCMSWGPLILGHAPVEVVEAVRQAAGRGLSYGACHAAEAELAEAILEGFPRLERVRLVSSGTEAVMTAVRLARAATGRDLVLKFSGGYHGHSDALLVAAGSGLATFGVPSSAGVAASVASATLVAHLDDVAALETLFADRGREIACVLLEPVPANDGVLPQRPELLTSLRNLCDRHGSLLVFDEVITGFRLRYGGAGEALGVASDLVTLGKIVGGGMPLAAVVGPAATLDRLAPLGPVYQAGTLSGNPVAVAAGLATLRALRDGSAHARVESLGARLERAVEAHGMARLRLVRVGSIFWPYLAEGPLPRRPEDISPDTVSRFARIHGRLVDRGLYLPPSAREACFLSTAHSEADVDALAETLAQEVSGLA